MAARPANTKLVAPLVALRPPLVVREHATPTAEPVRTPPLPGPTAPTAAAAKATLTNSLETISVTALPANLWPKGGFHTSPCTLGPRTSSICARTTLLELRTKWSADRMVQH